MKNIQETLLKVATIMDQIDGTVALNSCKGPNGSHLQFWRIGKEVCVIQYFKDGGCNHFIQGDGNTWASMKSQLELISKK